MNRLILVIFLAAVLVQTYGQTYLNPGGAVRNLKVGQSIKIRTHNRQKSKNYPAKNTGKLIWKIGGTRNAKAVNGYTKKMTCKSPFSIGNKNCNDHRLIVNAKNGRQTRCGTINPPPKFDLDPLTASTIEVQFRKVKKGYRGLDCTITFKANPVNGRYANWGQWSSCSQNCGENTRTRTRTCTNPAPAFGGTNCNGSPSQQSSDGCTTYACDSITLVPSYSSNFLSNVGQIGQNLRIRVNPVVPLDSAQTLEWVKDADGSVVSNTARLSFSQADIPPEDTGRYTFSATKYGITESLKVNIFQKALLVVGGDGGDSSDNPATYEFLNIASNDEAVCVNKPATDDVDEMKIGKNSDGDIVACASRGDENQGKDCYKLTRSVWTTHKDVLSQNRFEGRAVQIRNGMWFVGGPGDTDLTSEYLDFGTMTSTAGPEVTKVNGICLAAINNTHSFASGGFSQSYETSNEARVYNWDSEEWTDWEPMSVNRADHACFFFNNKMVVAGGYDSSSGYVASTEVLENEAWVNGDNVQDGSGNDMALVSSTMIEVDSTLLMIGGGSEGNLFDFNYVWEYQESTRSWSLRNDLNMKKARKSLSAIVIEPGFIMECE